MTTLKISVLYHCFLSLILIFLISSSPLFSQNNIWGNQETGEYNVGFKSFWLQDASRTFTYNNDATKRPLLVNIWYPSKHNKNKNLMTQSDYFQIQDSDILSSEISRDYKKYTLQILAYELFGKALSNFSLEEKSTFDEFLNRNISVQKESIPIKSKFPLIIYHQGFEASYEDNSVLIQLLASHGYIVIGSSFFSEDSFSVEGRTQSIQDIDFLLNYAENHMNVDMNNVALVGHSGGAQASILSKSYTHHLIKAVVAIETTQEMFGVSDTRWQDFTQPVIENISNMDTSLLALTNHGAVFQLYDRMSLADRIYITFPSKLSHNEYISQGIFANTLTQKLSSAANKPLTYFPAENEDLHLYNEVNQFILAFLEWKLKGKESLEHFFPVSNYKLQMDFDRALISRVSKGDVGPEKYDFHPERPITPRQAWQLAYLNNADTLMNTLNYFYEKDKENPVYHDLYAFSLISELIEENNIATAKRLFNFYRNKNISIEERFLSISRFSLMMRKPEYSKRTLLNLLKMNPGNIKAKEALEAAKY